MEASYQSASDFNELGCDVEFALDGNGIEYDSYMATGLTYGGTILSIAGVNPPWFGTQGEKNLLATLQTDGHTLTPLLED